MKTRAEVEQKLAELEAELTEVEPMSDDGVHGYTQSLVLTLKWVLGQNTYLDNTEGAT